MTRIKRGKITVKQRKKCVRNTKKFRGAWSTLARLMLQGSRKSLNQSYNDRRKKATIFRRLIITRSNAAIRAIGLPITYNNIISIFRLKNSKLNRNILNQLSVRDSEGFLNLMLFNIS